jgi:hypothetical protein
MTMTIAKPAPDFPQRKERVCLGPHCMGKKKFLSDHPGRRLCPRCAAQVGRDSAGSTAA